ncbi:hypothetical protein Nepgr_003779 [Nepenthes gracilis]|uniref:Uncharacterized protein n=1 Tax=Nepenthes gracilis TaxID=150966 RepID=A0AAD3S056_NEPGR|nr:hypothetical protein Nepgr_003779 [Nepenthes gracilis]
MPESGGPQRGEFLDALKKSDADADADGPSLSRSHSCSCLAFDSEGCHVAKYLPLNFWLTFQMMPALLKSDIFIFFEFSSTCTMEELVLELSKSSPIAMTLSVED